MVHGSWERDNLLELCAEKLRENSKDIWINNEATKGQETHTQYQMKYDRNISLVTLRIGI